MPGEHPRSERNGQESKPTSTPVKVYRCKNCRKVLFEARGVKGLSKRCPRCKTTNVYDD